MAERLKAPVLKTGDAKASVGSNPTLSAKVKISTQSKNKYGWYNWNLRLWRRTPSLKQELAMS